MKTKFLTGWCFQFLLISSTTYSQGDSKPVIKSVNQEQAFTCIAKDSKGNLWAGTKGAGLWKGTIGSNELSSLSFFHIGGKSNEQINNKYNIKTIAVSKTSEDKEVLWMGHNGLGSGFAAGGGIDKFTIGTAEGLHLIPERNDTLAKGLMIKYQKGDGLPSLDCRALTVDKYNQVWTAHGYHDLVISSGQPDYIDILTGQIVKGQPAGYYVTPGGLGVSREGNIFDNVFSSSPAIPYPAYTINPPPSRTPGSWQCLAVGAGNDEVWVSMLSYETYNPPPAILFTSCIIRFDLLGNYLGVINSSTAPELPFLNTYTSPGVSAIHFQKNRNVWVTFNQSKGLAVYVYDKPTGTQKWIYIDKLNYYNKATGQNETSKLLPAGILINNNSPGIIASDGQEAYIGTKNGILVYTGKGDYKQDSSYVLLTTNDGLSSNSITGLAYGDGYLYAATESGINQIKLRGKMEVFHIIHKDKPFEEKYNDKNYKQIAKLNDADLNANEEDGLPVIACDGTTSTVFRYYTGDFKGFYADKYKYGINFDFDGKDTSQYGKLILKPEKYYDSGTPDYVDFIYRHPNYIDENKFGAGKKIIFRLTIYNKLDVSSAKPTFNTPLEFSIPPLLLIHGVWSNVSSMEPIKKYFLNQKNYNFKDYQIRTCYRPFPGNGVLNPPELSYEHDVPVIKDNINGLISDCSDNGMSAGKVTIIAHSRGGLYTRAYVEEIIPGLTYEDDVNALICLNTPHAGTQLANLITDKRKQWITYPVSPAFPALPVFKLKQVEVGEVFSIFIPDDADKKNKMGVKALKVNEGYLITDHLNTPENLLKFKNNKIPVHNFATKFDPCMLNGFPLCELIDKKPLTGIAKRYVALYLILAVIKDTPKGINGFMKYLFRGEENDFIVPMSSMEAGLNSKYISKMPGENISHCDLPVLSHTTVTNSEKVHARLLELISQNVHSTTSSFTTEGFNPPSGKNRLKYVFPLFPESEIPMENKPAGADTSGIYIYKDSATSKIGDTLVTKIYHQRVSKIILKYSSMSSNDTNSLVYKLVDLNKGVTDFKFYVSNAYFGKLLITAYGVKDTNLVAMDEATLNVGLRDTTIKIKDIILNEGYPVVVENKRAAYFTLSALYSDAVKREIADFSKVKFYIRDSTVTTVKSNVEVRAKNKGETQLIAIYNKNLVDSVKILVEENPSEKQTFFDGLTGYLFKKEAYLNWSTSQEYNNKYFVVEKSLNKLTFDSIGVVKGAGTFYDASEYEFTDEKVTAKKNYYRIRWKKSDNLNAPQYSNVIEIVNDSLITGITTIPDTEQADVIVYPNPARDEIILHFNSQPAEKEMLFNIYNNIGQSLLEKKMINPDKDMRYDISFLPPGVYHITFMNKTGKSLCNKKFVVIKGS